MYPTSRKIANQKQFAAVLLQINLTAQEIIHITDNVLQIRSVRSYISCIQENYNSLKRRNEYLVKERGCLSKDRNWTVMNSIGISKTPDCYRHWKSWFCVEHSENRTRWLIFPNKDFEFNHDYEIWQSGWSLLQWFRIIKGVVEKYDWCRQPTLQQNNNNLFICLWST